MSLDPTRSRSAARGNPATRPVAAPSPRPKAIGRPTPPETARLVENPTPPTTTMKRPVAAPHPRAAELPTQRQAAPEQADLYAEPLAGWLMQLVGWIGLGGAIGIVLSMVLLMVF